MHTNVKKYADSNDITSLRYVFYDCLDVDPSFDKYIEDYEYACKVSGFLDEHIDLTSFSSDESEWDEDYWLSLKKDLKKNFSFKRFNHMKDVARVVHADRLKRIEDERAKKNSSVEKKETSSLKAEPKPQQTESKPQQAKSKPQQAEPKPQQAEPKPRQAESKPQQAELKPQQVEPQSQKKDVPPKQETVANNAKADKSSSSEKSPVQKIDNSAYERQREKEAQERLKKQREIEEANRIAAEERAREERLKKVIGIVVVIVVVIVAIYLMTR